MITSYDESKFGDAFLDDIICWIADNFRPVEVFGEDALKAWAEEWAEDNGYVLEEEIK